MGDRRVQTGWPLRSRAIPTPHPNFPQAAPSCTDVAQGDICQRRLRICDTGTAPARSDLKRLASLRRPEKQRRKVLNLPTPCCAAACARGLLASRVLRAPADACMHASGLRAHLQDAVDLVGDTEPAVHGRREQAEVPHVHARREVVPRRGWGRGCSRHRSICVSHSPQKKIATSKFATSILARAFPMGKGYCGGWRAPCLNAERRSTLS